MAEPIELQCRLALQNVLPLFDSWLPLTFFILFCWYSNWSHFRPPSLNFHVSCVYSCNFHLYIFWLYILWGFPFKHPTFLLKFSFYYSNQELYLFIDCSFLITTSFSFYRCINNILISILKYRLESLNISFSEIFMFSLGSIFSCFFLFHVEGFSQMSWLLVYI